MHVAPRTCKLQGTYTLLACSLLPYFKRKHARVPSASFNARAVSVACLWANTQHMQDAALGNTYRVRCGYAHRASPPSQCPP
jgi:hypothetical protein